MEFLKTHCQSALDPCDDRPTPEWAHDNVQLFSPLTKTGFFDVSISRQLIGPFEALDDHSVREENVRAPVRSGKTLIADVWLPSLILRNPGPFRWVFQDDKAAKDQCELRTWQILLAIPEIAAMLPDSRHKNRTQEIIFPGMPVHVGGPALGQLQSRGWRYMVADEPWQYKPGRLDEIKGRLGDFLRMGTSKLLCISQAGEEGDDWDQQFNRGIIHEWAVFCLGCGKPFRPVWGGQRADGSRWGMRWDEHKDAQGLWIPERCLSSVRYECQHCGHPHIDTGRTKNEWNRTGFYEIEDKDKSRSKKSHHWTGVIDYPWTFLVESFLASINSYKTGTFHAMIAFFQKYMAENKSERTVLEGSRDLTRVTYEIKDKWEFEDVRFFTVDRQEEDVFWAQARAWSKRKKRQSRRIWRGKLFSFVDLEAKRVELGIHPAHVLIDSAYRPKGDNGVYAACVRYGWIAVNGEGDPFFWHPYKGGRVRRSYAVMTRGDPESGTVFQGRRQAKLIRFSADEMSERLSNLISRGEWIEPTMPKDDPDEIEYRKQMSAEFRKKFVNERTYEVTFKWVCPSKNNHQWDCAKEQVLAAILFGAMPDPFEEMTEKPLDPTKGDPLVSRA